VIIIDYYNDTDILKEAISSEEERLKSLRNFSKEIKKARKELNEIDKKTNK